MNVEIGAEAAQFPEKEYINGIVFAVLQLSRAGRRVGSILFRLRPLWSLFSSLDVNILRHGEKGCVLLLFTFLLQGPQKRFLFTDGWSKPDFVKDILVRPISSSATSAISKIRELHGEVDSIQPF